MRYRCIPVYGEMMCFTSCEGCVPAAYGNTICSYILHSRARKVFRPSTVVPLNQDIIVKMHNRLVTKEKQLYGNTEWVTEWVVRSRVSLDRFDLYYLMQSIFKQKSIFSGCALAGNKLEFTRWDVHKLPTLDNLVLGTVEECQKHEKEGLEGMNKEEKERIQEFLDSRMMKEGREDVYY